MAITRHDLKQFVESTLLYAENRMEIKYFDEVLGEFMRNKRSSTKPRKLSEDEISELDFVGQCMHFLERYEFIRLQYDDANHEVNFISTRLGYACLGIKRLYQFGQFRHENYDTINMFSLSL